MFRNGLSCLCAAYHTVIVIVILAPFFVTAALQPKNQLYLVCKRQEFNWCVKWNLTKFLTKQAIDDLPIEEKFYPICGISKLNPVSPHKKFIKVSPLHHGKGKYIFCKTSAIKNGGEFNSSAAEKAMATLRTRRQTPISRGRYRGQTQSQYLAIDQGNNKSEGKAEAHSAADSSRASVSGNSGMGQAQSQSIYDPSCDECDGKPKDESQYLHSMPGQNHASKGPLGSFPGYNKHSSGENQPGFNRNNVNLAPNLHGLDNNNPNYGGNNIIFPKDVQGNPTYGGYPHNIPTQGTPEMPSIGGVFRADRIPPNGGLNSGPNYGNNLGLQPNYSNDHRYVGQKLPGHNVNPNTGYNPYYNNGQGVPNANNFDSNRKDYPNQAGLTQEGSISSGIPRIDQTNKGLVPNQGSGNYQDGLDDKGKGINFNQQFGLPNSGYGNWPFLTGTFPDGTYYCCVVSPQKPMITGNNNQFPYTGSNNYQGTETRPSQPGTINTQFSGNNVPNNLLSPGTQNTPTSMGTGTYPSYNQYPTTTGSGYGNYGGPNIHGGVQSPGGQIAGPGEQNGYADNIDRPQIQGSETQPGIQPSGQVGNLGGSNFPGIYQTPGQVGGPNLHGPHGKIGITGVHNFQGPGGQIGESIEQNGYSGPGGPTTGLGTQYAYQTPGVPGVQGGRQNNGKPGVQGGYQSPGGPGNQGVYQGPGGPTVQVGYQGPGEPSVQRGYQGSGGPGVQGGYQGHGEPGIQGGYKGPAVPSGHGGYQGPAGPGIQGGYQGPGGQIGSAGFQGPGGQTGGTVFHGPGGQTGGTVFHGPGGQIGATGFQGPGEQIGGPVLQDTGGQIRGTSFQGPGGQTGVPSYQGNERQTGGPILQGPGGQTGVSGYQGPGGQSGGPVLQSPGGQAGSSSYQAPEGQNGGLGRQTGGPGYQGPGGQTGGTGFQGRYQPPGGHSTVQENQGGYQSPGQLSVPGGYQGSRGPTAQGGYQGPGGQTGGSGYQETNGGPSGPGGTQYSGFQSGGQIGTPSWQGGQIGSPGSNLYGPGVQPGPSGWQTGQIGSPGSLTGITEQGTNVPISGIPGSSMQGGGSSVPDQVGFIRPGGTAQDGSKYPTQLGSGTQTGGAIESGGPQNVLDPNSVSNVIDGEDSEAQASVSQANNGTIASASSKGGNDKGRAQTNVQGTYTGSGSFSAQAQISDDNKAAASEVSGGKQGASGKAQGSGKNNKSQASVQLGSETGSIQTQSQSDGTLHSSNSQVQGSVKGGMADSQARGSGITSSQAQIGFTPYKAGDKSHDLFKTPFVGSGTSSAQSSGRTGQSQSQLRGTFKYGITYNGAAQAGASLDKDAVFLNRLNFEKINVFDEKEKNIDVDSLQPAVTTASNEPQLNENESQETPIPSTGDDYSDHPHYNHHKIEPKPPILENATPEGNKRSFQTTYGPNSSDYEYKTDKDEEYDQEEGLTTGLEPEYPNYDEVESTHQSLQSNIRKPLDVKQTINGNSQHIVFSSLKNQDAYITQKTSQRPDESKVYQPGEKVPGTGGYTIPFGFTGSVKSVASRDNTYVVGSKDSPSQAQTVSIRPGTGKVKYVYPTAHSKNIPSKDLRSLRDGKSNDNRYVSVSKSVTNALDGKNNIQKQYSHTYYTKSSSCGYFTFTCTMVSGVDGKKKVCRPKIPTNPDGTLMRC